MRSLLQIKDTTPNILPIMHPKMMPPAMASSISGSLMIIMTVVITGAITAPIPHIFDISFLIYPPSSAYREGVTCFIQPSTADLAIKAGL